MAYSGVAKPFDELTRDDFQVAMRVTVEGSLIGINEVTPHMTNGGAIVNLSCTAAFDGAPMNAPL